MKMNIQLVIACILFPILVFGQNKFSAGINLSPELTKMVITNDNSASSVVEKGKIGLGYALGLHFRYDLNENIFLRSGASFRKLNHRHKIDGLTFTSTSGTISHILNTIQISSIGVPLDIGYKISSNNENIKYVIGGSIIMNTNLNIESNAIIVHEQADNESLAPSDEIEAAMVSGGLFTAMEFKVKDKYILGIEPNIRFTPNSFIMRTYNSEARTAIEAGLTIRMSLN